MPKIWNIYISYDANGGRTYGRSKIMYNFFTSINKNEYTSNNTFLGWFAYNVKNKQGYCYDKQKLLIKVGLIKIFAIMVTNYKTMK